MNRKNTVGRPHGSTTRPVINARRAISQFVEANIPRLNGWLEQVANGIPAVTATGQRVLDSNGCTVWLCKPDPLAALKVVGDLTEYHLPKLSRQEISATVENLDVSQMSSAEINRRIMEAMGVRLDAVEGEFVEVVPVAPERSQTG